MITEAERTRLMEDAAFASAFEKAMNKEVLGEQREYTEEEKNRVLRKYERTKQRKCNNAKRHKRRK